MLQLPYGVKTERFTKALHAQKRIKHRRSENNLFTEI